LFAKAAVLHFFENLFDKLRRNINERKTVINVNRADGFAGNIGFVGNRADDIAGIDAVLATDINKKAHHSFFRK
jgi:hypothetical protein